MDRKARTEKLMVLGVDGLDPRLTRKYVDAGLLPNFKKLTEGMCKIYTYLFWSQKTDKSRYDDCTTARKNG